MERGIMDHRTSTYLKRKHRFTMAILLIFAVVMSIWAYRSGIKDGRAEVHAQIKDTIDKRVGRRIGPVVLSPMGSSKPKDFYLYLVTPMPEGTL